MMSLAGKVALVTGASNGIGKACVERLARDGASVVINYNRDKTSAESLVSSIGSDRALAVQADVSSIPGIKKLIDESVARFGKVDIVMANAGVMPMRTVETTTLDDFTNCFDMNVKGPYFLVQVRLPLLILLAHIEWHLTFSTQQAIPHMSAGGRIIFVSSSLCHASAIAPDYLLYAASKGAIEQMTRVMAKGLASNGITVNAVGPGPVATELFFKGKSEPMIEGIKKAHPFGRLGAPDDIAGVVSFLAGQDSSWVTGQTYLVNGGMMV